jgi:xyloglucan-specific exo-beta-1,4-glucanase
MRGKRLSAILTTLATVAAAAVPLVAITAVLTAAPSASAATATQPYTWQNVKIGGGGFIDGIEFSPAQQNLLYAHTDIGGAYRWNSSTSTWTPLLDWVGGSNWGWNGVVSLAPDPSNANKVWAAVGMYTNSFDPNNGAILRSSNQGATWQSTTLPFKLGGNMPGRGMGERLAVDPNDDNILYLGAPSGNGLWRSTDGGVTWSQVTSFPNVGNYAPDPTDTSGYSSALEGVTWVAFDKATGTTGSATQTIFAGVADLQNTVYESTNGGSTWTRVAGQPTGFMAHHGVVDPANGILYIATSNTGGPYDGSSGDVWKYTIATGAWTQISPVSSTGGAYYGYSGLAIDPEHPSTIMVTAYSSWWPDTIIWRSTNGGSTWNQIWNWTSYPSRSFSYTQDISSEPWLTFNQTPTTPVVTPLLGWMTEDLAIDPFNSNRMLYGTGATLYATSNLTNWDSGGTITIAPMVNGIEETAVNALISPPSGPPLLSALGDLDGFVHTSLTTVPTAAQMYQSPSLTSGDSLDYAELNPSDIVRTGDVNKTTSPNVNRIGFSTNGGTNWFQGQEPPNVTGGGIAAESANASSTVWSPAGTGVYYSTSFGGSWTASTGIPAGATVASDRVTPTEFYGFSGGTFYVSTNSGASFAATAATGLPTSGTVFIKAMPGHAGDVWLAGGSSTNSGIWHSTNSGATFTKLSNVTAAQNIGFGKAAPGQTYLALYTIATIGGTQGIFRSDDAGANWIQINDAQHQWGNIGQAITGDPRVYGRVYVGTNGRGIIYGDPSGNVTPSPSPSTTSASPTPTPTTSPTPTPTTSPSPTPTPTPSTTGTAVALACHVSYSTQSQWAGGFVANVTVSDTGTAPINGWTLVFTFAGDQKVTSDWGTTITQSGAKVTAANVSYDGAISAGGNTSFGFQGTWASSDSPPTSFAVNGVTCT